MKNTPTRLLLFMHWMIMLPALAQSQNSSPFDWNYTYTRTLVPSNTISSSQGTVCDNAAPFVINYYNYYGKTVTPGGVSWNDSAGIENGAAAVAPGARFKAVAGKPVTLTINLLVNSPNSLNGFNGAFSNAINGNVEARIGTRARSTENGSNLLYDTTINCTKTSGPVAQAFGNAYTFTVTFKFKRGSPTGYVFLTVPVLNYDGQTRYEEFIVSYLVAGPLDEQVKAKGITTEPQMPYMVLHDPPGDGSTATLNTTTRSCRTLEETYSTDESNSIFGTVKLGLKGSIGFVATIDYEIFAEFSAGVTLGDLKIGSTSTENCVAISNTLTTSDLDPNAGNDDLFIGYGMDLSYGVTENLNFSGCSYFIDTSLIFSPVDGTTREFRYTKKEILADIDAQLAKLKTPGFTPKDSATVMYQVNVWKQVLALNDSNIAHPNTSGSVTKNYGSGITDDYSKTVDVTQSKSITVEHYIEAEAGLQGVVNIGGSGFSLGYKFNTSKRFGNTGSASNQQSQTIAYHLYDGDDGDNFNVKIVTDPMFGTAMFQLLPGTKTSCPYEGGIQRDQPKLAFAGTNADTIIYPNVNVGEFQSFDLTICNDAAEPRQYRLRLKNNINNAVVTVGGNAGPEFTSNAPIALGAKGSANACVTYQVDVKQLNTATLSFPNLEFELYDLCDDGISQSVFATVNYGTLVRSLKSGDWNNTTTWEAKRVPQPTDNVIINTNHVVTIPASIQLKCKSVTLNPTSTLVVPPSSKLDITGQ